MKKSESEVDARFGQINEGVPADYESALSMIAYLRSKLAEKEPVPDPTPEQENKRRLAIPPESPAKEQLGEQNAAPQVPSDSGASALEKQPAASAADLVRRIRQFISEDSFHHEDGTSEPRLDANPPALWLLDEAAALIEKLGQGWIPVSEKLPTAKDANERGHVLAWDKREPSAIIPWKWVEAHGWDAWMPLPPPPERP